MREVEPKGTTASQQDTANLEHFWMESGRLLATISLQLRQAVPGSVPEAPISRNIVITANPPN